MMHSVPMPWCRGSSKLRGKLMVRFLLAVFVLGLGLPSQAGDWPMFGRDHTHNAVSLEKGHRRTGRTKSARERCDCESECQRKRALPLA